MILFYAWLQVARESDGTPYWAGEDTRSANEELESEGVQS